MITAPAEEASKAERTNRRTLSALALVLANLVPIAGVLYWGWGVDELLIGYWTETLVVGVFTVLRMLTAKGEVPGDLPPGRVHPALVRLVLSLFFTMHFGIFVVVHGTLLFAFLQSTAGAERLLSSGISGVVIMTGGLFLSHGHSYLANYIGRQEYKTTDVTALMREPYPRILVMHFTLILGAFLVLYSESPIRFLVVFVALKIALDLRWHRRAHTSPK